MPEEQRARRKRCLWLLGVGGLALLTIVAAATGRPQRAIKRWHSSRLAQSALSLIAAADYKAANPKVRDALQFDFQNKKAWLAAARILSRTGQFSGALEWWRKIAASTSLSAADRRDYAAAALGGGALTEAEQQVNELLHNPAPLPADLLLDAQLASRHENGVRALEQAERVLADKRTQPNERMSAALLIYSITTPSSPPYAKAWYELAKLASDPANPMSLDALVFMARQPGPAAAGAPLDAPVQMSLGTSGGLPSDSGSPQLTRSQIADALASHPKAKPYHHLLALEARASVEPGKTGELLREAVDRFKEGDDETLTELGSWLYRSGRCEMLLQTIPLDRALKQQNLFLQRLDALSALGRFREVAELLQSQRFPLDAVLEHTYLAIARSRLGEQVAASNEWERALESANDTPKLLAVGGYAEKSLVFDVAEKAYSAACLIDPKSRPAHAGRLRATMQQGRTVDAFREAAEIVELWPEDSTARNDRDYLGLLLQDPVIDPTAAERHAETLTLKLPSNWSARATLALARLRQERVAAALRAFDGVKATGSEPAGALAIRAAVLAANGWIDGARNDARNLATARLLPEERALIAPLTVAENSAGQ